jgi:hypothetical protein
VAYDIHRKIYALPFQNGTTHGGFSSPVRSCSDALMGIDTRATKHSIVWKVAIRDLVRDLAGGKVRPSLQRARQAFALILRLFLFQGDGFSTLINMSSATPSQDLTSKEDGQKESWENIQNAKERKKAQNRVAQRLYS